MAKINIKVEDILDPKKQHELVVNHISKRPSLVKKAIDSSINELVRQVVRDVKWRDKRTKRATESIGHLENKIFDYIPGAVDKILLDDDALKETVKEAVLNNFKRDFRFTYIDWKKIIASELREIVATEYAETLERAVNDFDFESEIKKMLLDKIGGRK